MEGRKLVLPLCCLVALVASRAPAEGLQGTYDAIFGDQEKKVLRTRSTTDDAEFAAQLVVSAQSVSDAPDLQVFLCEKAYDFGVKNPAGYVAAVEAMKLLEKVAPDRKDQARQKLLKLYELQYSRGRRSERLEAGKVLLGHLVAVADAKMAEDRAGDAVALYRRALSVASFVKSPRKDEIIDKSKVASDHHKADQEIARLRKVLKDKPDDRAAARRLLILHLVEKGDQKKAAALLNAVGPDESLRKYVPLAAEDLEGVPPAVCLELGRWHASLSAGASTTGKTRTLERAIECYGRFLSGYKKEDDLAAKARRELDSIEKQLAGREGGLSRLLREVRIVSAGLTSGNMVRIVRKGKVLFESAGQRARGITLVAIDRDRAMPPRTFDTHGDGRAADRFAEAVEKLPRGCLVILAVCDEATSRFNQRAQKAILSVGGKTGLLGRPFRCSYYLIGRKGLSPGAAVEKVSREKLVYPPARKKR